MDFAMAAPLKTVEGSNIAALMHEIGQRAKSAARVLAPIGVVGIIYESRPNVTADAAALCLKAGNAAILRGGSESHRSNQAIHAALTEGMRTASLPEAAISLVPTRDRSAVGMML